MAYYEEDNSLSMYSWSQCGSNFSMAHINYTFIAVVADSVGWLCETPSMVRISSEMFNVQDFSYCVSVNEHSADTFVLHRQVRRVIVVMEDMLGGLTFTGMKLTFCTRPQCYTYRLFNNTSRSIFLSKLYKNLQSKSRYFRASTSWCTGYAATAAYLYGLA